MHPVNLHKTGLGSDLQVTATTLLTSRRAHHVRGFSRGHAAMIQEVKRLDNAGESNFVMHSFNVSFFLEHFNITAP
jgi:hypothetical protein